MKGKIILLNGVSSSGKTTLAKELVKLLPGHFHLSIDEFDHIIDRMEDRAAQRLIPVPTETFFHRNIAMFSDHGVNLVVDQILHDEASLRDCLRTLRDYPVFFVGVHCSPRELEQREKERGDRRIGLSNSQSNFVHKQNEIYDIEVNTSIECTESCAVAVVNTYLNTPEPNGWPLTVKSVLEL